MDLADAIRTRVLRQVDEATAAREWAPVQRMSSTGSCLRQQWYNIAIPQERQDDISGPPGRTWEMRDGDLHERDLKYWLREAGFTITREQEDLTLELPSGETVTGHPDGEIIGHELREPYVLECKSMSWMRFISLSKQGVQASHPDIYMQCNLYAYAMGRPGTILIAKAKDSSATNRGVPEGMSRKLYVQDVALDLDSVTNATRRHSALAKYLFNGTTPDREYRLTSDWQCDPRFCAFSRTCWGEPAVEEFLESKQKGRKFVRKP